MRKNQVLVDRIIKLYSLRTLRHQLENDDDGFKVQEQREYQPDNLSYLPIDSLSPLDYAAAVKHAYDHRIELLNIDQKPVHDFIRNNPGSIILIQAGPGTGKTFTMLCIAYYYAAIYGKKDNVLTVIFKHDLLNKFQHCSRRSTTAKFCMDLFGVDFNNFRKLDKQIAANMSVEEVMLSVVGLLKLALNRAPNVLRNCRILILDEHTLLPKILMFVIVLLAKIIPTTVIFCGDRKQLHNIHNSVHAGDLSTYDIIASSADRAFTLTINERCKDKQYNAIIEYVSQFSSSRKLDKFAFALTSAIFYDRLTISPRLSDTHIAGTHRILTNTVAKLVMNNDIKVSFYYITARAKADRNRIRGDFIKENGLYFPHASQNYTQNHKIGKFLPYLPLVIGGWYYVKDHSESTISELLSFDLNTQGEEEVCLLTPQGRVTLKKGPCGKVMFEEHAKFILEGGDEASNYDYTGYPIGSVYNFPIYPANIMSIHMSQGRTVSSKVNLMLANCSYEQLYVAISRVTERSMFNCISIPDTLSYLVSTILNYDKLATEPDNHLDVASIKQAFEMNYKLYDLHNYDPAKIAILQIVAPTFVKLKDVAERCALREYIVSLCCDARVNIVAIPEEEAEPEVPTERNSSKVTISRQIDPRLLKLLFNSANNPTSFYKFTLSYLLEDKTIFYALALMNSCDTFVWIREYLMNGSSLKTILSDVLNRKSIKLYYDENDIKYNHDGSLNTLKEINLISLGYRNKENTVDYIKRVSTNSLDENIASSPKHENATARKESKPPNSIENYFIREDSKESTQTVTIPTGTQPTGKMNFASRIIAQGLGVNGDWLRNELNLIVDDLLATEQKTVENLQQERNRREFDRLQQERNRAKSFDEFRKEAADRRLNRRAKTSRDNKRSNQ